MPDDDVPIEQSPTSWTAHVPGQRIVVFALVFAWSSADSTGTFLERATMPNETNPEEKFVQVLYRKSRDGSSL